MRRNLALFILPLLLWASSGCSNSSGRQNISGQVTYNGKPVPYGTVYFDPDSSKGNNGPQGVGEIRDGKYRNKPGFGPFVGPHNVRIIGSESERSDQRLPFGEYKTSVDIQPGQSKLDFDIPAN
jgi:hypothetical protein